jgi:predicted MFS family arabinose efflux permease
VNETKIIRPGLTLAVLTGLNLFNYLDRYVLAAVLEPMKIEFSLTDGQAGRITTVFMLGYFLTSPLFGWLGDRAPRRWLVAAGVFVWSLGTVGTGWAAAFGTLLFRVLVGVGEASYATVSPAWIADLYPKERRNNALTIFYVAVPVGSALGVLLGSQVAAHFGWRYAFYWAGGPGLLLALLGLFLPEPRRGATDGAGAPSAQPAPGDYLGLLRRPSYLLVVGGYVAFTFALGAFGNWGPTFLTRIHGVSSARAGLFFGGTLMGAGLVSTFVGGFAATVWQRRNPAGYAWMLGLSTLAAVPVALGAFLTGSLPLAMGLLALAMLLLFLSTGPVNTLILETVPANMRASAMAVAIFAIHLGGDLWSTEIVGRLSDALGSLRRGVLILPFALAVCSALWLWLAVRTRREARAG